MNIVLTGSLGNINRHLVVELVANRHMVTVISSSSDRQKEIEQLGAKAAIGTMEDASFLTQTFKGADAVYCMETFDFFNADFDYMKYVEDIVNNYKQAIKASDVKKVIHLSSIGAHTSEGMGILKFHHLAERLLNQLPEDIIIKFIRPVGFYVNLLGQIPNIKSQGILVSNFGSDKKEPWVSPSDIANVIAEEFDRPFIQREFRYVASDEISAHEIAAMLGAAIGNPELKWITMPSEQYLEGLLQFGMNKQIAEDYVTMQEAQKNGSIYTHFNRHRPTFGNVKFRDFAKEFGEIYNKHQ